MKVIFLSICAAVLLAFGYYWVSGGAEFATKFKIGQKLFSVHVVVQTSETPYVRFQASKKA